MKTLQAILNKKTYKIVDEEGNILEAGFRNKTSASQMCPKFKLSRTDKIFVEEENV